MTVDWSGVDAASRVVVTRRQRDAKRAAAALFVVAAAEFAVLAMTGVLLLKFYRPSAARAWADPRARRSYSFTAAGLLRLAHRSAAHAMVVTLLAIAVVGVVLAVSRPSPLRRHLTAAAGIGALAVGLVASYTGFLLPWDQLALWAVTVGTNMMGYRPIISGGSNVQYVLIGGSQVSLSTMRWWLLIHSVVAPGVLMALGGFMAWRVRRHRPARHTGLGS